MDEKLIMVDEAGNEVEVIVLEQTTLNGTDYLLVSESDDEEADCYILKDLSAKDDPEANYVEVEDDAEWESIASLFEELLAGEDEE